MRTKVLSSLLAVIVMGTLLAQPALADTLVSDYTGTEEFRPVCPAPGRFEPTVAPFDLEFDFMTTIFYGPTGDSLPVFVNEGGDGTNNYKFIAFPSDRDIPIEQECQDTSTAGIQFWTGLFS